MPNGSFAPQRQVFQGDVLVVDGQSYRVGDQLKQLGDNPAFISWRLDPVPEIEPGAAVGAPARRKVLKLASGGKTAMRSEDFKSQIDQEREDVLRMEGIKTVPAYYPEAAKSIQHGEEVVEAILVREFVDGVLLSKWMELYEQGQQPKRRVFAGMRDVSQWFDLACKLVDALVPIHNERLVHGDLRPRSIILRGARDAEGHLLSSVTGIDVVYLDTEDDLPSTYEANGITDHGTFRRKYDSPLRVFEKKKEMNAPFVIASRSPAQWLAPTDIFSLGMILFELAFGSEAELAPFLDESAVKPQGDLAWYKVGSYQARKGNRQLKDSLFDAWKARLKRLDLWGVAGEKESPELRMGFLRMREVILACVRLNKNTSTTDLEAIQRIIKAFRPSVSPAAAPRHSSSPSAGWLETVRGGMEDFLANKGKSFPRSFIKLIWSNSERLVSRLEKLTENNCGFLRISGRDSIVETIVYLLNGLEKDHCFEALVAPSFFSRENMGLHGRVTTALQLAAIEGKSVRWLIVVNEKELHSQQVAEVLQQHNTAWRHIHKFLKNPGQIYGVSYAILSDESYNRLLREQVTSLAIGANDPTDPQEGDAYKSLLEGVGLLIAPDYHGEMGEISALRLWPGQGQEDEGRHKVRRKTLQEFFKKYQGARLQIETFYR